MVYQDGEMTNLDNFKAALEDQISGVTYYEETEKQIAVTGTSITLSSANIASGETYSATLINSAGEVAATAVTANDGSVTLTFASAPAVGSANVVLRSSSKAITFTNVLLVTGTISNYTQLKAITGKTESGYYVLTNDITDASGSINLRAGTFSGVLDGNGYTVDGVSVGASGLFRVLNGATIKNVKFTNFSAQAPAFGTTATNCTFENVTVSFKSGGPNLVTTATNCTYKNVMIYVPSASAISMPDGVKVMVGADTGKTFYIAEGETEVWLRDSNIAIGNYTVDVNGEVYNTSVFTAGRIKVKINGLALGETIKVSCDNGTSAYVYNVMRVSKIVYAESGEQLPTYNGDKTALDYYNSDVVQTLTVANGDGSLWDGGIWSNRVKIFASGTQDYITVDFVAENDFVGTMFQIWPTKGAGSLSKTGVFNDSDDPTGATVSIVDEYGFTVNTVSAGKRYTLRVYDPNATGLALSVWGANTIYFGNVTYGEGTPQEPITPPNVTVGDNRVYSIYKGDETALGFENGTMVFLLENNTPDNIYGDGWGKRMIFGASTAQDYITFEFVAKEDVEAADIFHVWGVNGAPSIGTVSASTGKGGDWAIILDKHGLAVTSIKAGKHYFASIACAGLKEIQVGALDVNEIYVANVTEHNGALPTAIQPLVYGVDNSALSVYEGEKTALGFEESTLVFESTAGANTWNDNAIKFYTDSAKNCVEIDFALDKALVSNCNQFMIWSSVASGATFITNGNVVVNETSIDIEIFDAEGNVATSFEANKKYTFKIYHEGSTDVTIALVGDTQAGVTIYYAHDYRQNNDVLIGLPENVVTYSTDGGHTGENLSKYKGDATAYGFGAEDYVFEGVMSSSWNDRVIIPVDSTNYDYMDVEFVVTSGLWYFNMWVVNANEMLDGSYLVAENAGNTTYGSGFAVYNDNPETDKVDGKTRIQVLDVDGNVVTGVRTVGTRYILRVYTNDESLTGVQLGQANTTILFANVTYGIEETIVGTTNTSCVTVYDGDETALGFEEGSRVYTYVGTDASTDKASFKVDSTYDYVDVQVVIGSGDGYFFAYALNGGNYLNGGASYVIDPSDLRLANDATMDRTIEVYDANGNLASTLMSTNTLYTLRVYTDGMDEFRIAKAGSTIYLANVTFGNDAAVEKPEEVIVWGEGKEELPQYTGNNADIGFDDDDYVFEHITRAPVTEGGDTTYYQWSDRAHIGNDSDARFLVFEFSMPNPANMTIWFTRNNNVVAGFSNVFGTNGAVWKHESDARTIFALDSNNVKVTTINANTKYTLWVYLNGADDFDGIAIGGSSSGTTIYYANVRYMYGTGDNVILQGEANSLLAEYTGDVTDIGFEAGTFVQTLTGTSDIWIEDIYANRARITADGTQTYIAVDFIVKDAITGDFLFKIWSPNSTFDVKSGGDCTYYKAKVIDQDGWVVTTIEPGVKYTLIVQDAGATYLAIGAYCNNTIYFGHVTYGYEDPVIYAMLKDGNGVLATYDGDESAIGFTNGELVQVWSTQPTGNWSTDAESKGFRLYGDGNSYTSINFSLESDLVLTDLFMFGWGHHDTGYTSNNSYILGANASDTNARLFDKNCNLISSGTLTAKTVYTLEVYFPEGTVWFNVGNVGSTARTVYFATNSVKTYKTSIAAIKGSFDGTVTLYQGTEDLGFGRNEVVKRLDTETVSDVWNGVQSTSGKKRSSWLANIASSAGKVVKVRFALSKDFNSTGTLFYVWAYSDNSGTCPKNGSVNLSGTGSFTGTTSFARIVDEDGNAVTEIKANRVYVLEVYCDTAIKYDVGNFVAEGMTTYFGDVSYENYVA